MSLPNLIKSGPITRERMESALEWLAHAPVLLAEAKGNRDRAEYMIKVTLSLQMKVSPENALGAQERDARASEKYKQAIDEHVSCVISHEKLLGQRKAAEATIEVWRSLNASQRHAP